MLSVPPKYVTLHSKNPYLDRIRNYIRFSYAPRCSPKTQFEDVRLPTWRLLIAFDTSDHTLT